MSPKKLQPSTVHDLRHSLFALRTGIDLLAQISGDAAEQREEVLKQLRKEIRTASELLAQLLEERKP